MFSLDFYIDTFQNAKKTMTDSIIKDTTLNQAAHNFIEAQTVFGKMLAKNTCDILKYSADSYSKLLFPFTNK